MTFAPLSIALALALQAADSSSAAATSSAPAISSVAASAPVRSDYTDELAEHALSYGDHLFNDGDYYRAIGEYRRFLYLARGLGPDAQRAAMAVGEAYLRGRQFEAAAAQFESVASRSQAGVLRTVALLNAGRAHLLGDRPLLAAARLADARDAAGADRALADEAMFLLGWARAGQKDWDGARSAFAGVAAHGGMRAASAADAVAHLDQRAGLEEKNPLLAGALSCLPGLGHMYLGQWSVGVAALMWNALFIGATGYSLYSQEWGVAVVLGVFEMSWFAGTMFGALNGAFRHNQDVVANWMDDLEGALGSAREIGPVREAPGRPGDLERLAPLAASGPLPVEES
ncbi:MAG: hypothetical protein JXR83_13270 [Deltaproteobacteria bacterium]|nr:hypothetical protein [Deltaproteobacteria bacterium]